MKTTEANLKEDVNETPTVKSVELKKDDMIVIHIDREMTDGGLRTNGILQVGDIKVTKAEADDLLRRQEEYFETKKKLMDKYATVRMKSDYQKETLFLADPSVNESKKNFTRDYGLLGSVEWGFCSDKFKAHLLSQRKMLYGY